MRAYASGYEAEKPSNQIELWFSIFARKVLRRGSFSSTEDLKRKVDGSVSFRGKLRSG
jgi:hypothetical protein